MSDYQSRLDKLNDEIARYSQRLEGLSKQEPKIDNSSGNSFLDNILSMNAKRLASGAGGQSPRANFQTTMMSQPVGLSGLMDMANTIRPPDKLQPMQNNITNPYLKGLLGV